MNKDADKAKGSGLNTLTGQLDALGTHEATNLARDIRSKRERALRLVSGEDQAEREENEKEKRLFIIGLAFNNGDMQKGHKDSIGLSQKDLDRMDEIGVRFSYSGDVVFNMSAHSDIIPFILPNGQTGELCISIDVEKGEFKCDFRKDIKRRDEGVELSVAGGIA